jgi:guanylate kinase
MSLGQLILVSAPSGAGKTSLVNAALQQDDNLVVSISHTTRDVRAGEADGVNYHFVSATRFNNMIAADEFLEHAKVFDHHYGTALAQVDALRANSRDVVLEIDWQGADQVRLHRPDALSIFVLPPSVEVLRERLRSRGRDSEASMDRRLAEAQLEISQAPRYQYIVVNDDFEQALADILAIIRAARSVAPRQIHENQVVKAILSAH